MKQGEEISNDAINDFVAIVGIDFVKTDSGVIARYARSTLASGTSPSAVVLPKHTAEIQRIVKIAAQYHLQIHPISTGKNWGYSDACAPRGGNVILDLSRMNTIVEVSEDMCYATIEPGVTQGQLYEYLHEKKIHLWMDATGAGPDTSIIGNVLERGFGHSPHGDRFAHSCAYEIVLPSGEILNTGFAHHKNSRVSEVYK